MSPGVGAAIIVTLCLGAGALGACDPPAKAAETVEVADDAVYLGMPMIDPCLIGDIDGCVTDVWGPALATHALMVIYGRSRYPDARCPWGESTGKVDARNGSHYGLLQIGRAWRKLAASLGYTWSEVATQARPNLTVGLAIYEQYGWRQWSCASRSWGKWE